MKYWEDDDLSYGKKSKVNTSVYGSSRYSSAYDDYDYGYGYGYGYKSSGSKRSASYGGFDKSMWSSYSWGSSWAEDDNSGLFVKDPVSYITPTSSDITKKYRIWNQSQIDTVKELARVCYFKMIDDREYISEKFSDYDSLSDGQKEDYSAKKSLYDQVFEEFIPGFTPIEQAISIFRRISNVKSDGSPSDEEMNYESTLSFDRKCYTDPELNEQLDFNEISKNYKMDILNKISIVSDFGEHFKVEKEISEKIVSNSNQFSKRIMRDYAQFSQIDLYQKMLPSFKTKFLTKDLTVNVPVDRKEKTQKIIILLDFSGSMDEELKQQWVNAILIDRLRYVMRGEAEVFFSYFVHRTKDLNFQHLKNREDVLNFWSTFSNSPNGGMTAIGEIVTYIDQEISSGRLHNLDIDLSAERPEILIINDGQDSIGYDSLPYKVNAISLDTYCQELSDLCVATEGKQVHIDFRKDKIKYYSKGAETQELNFKNK